MCQSAQHVAEVVRVGEQHSTPSSRHTPVLVTDVVQLMQCAPDAVIVDGTVGMGGHSAALVRHLPHGRLITLDRDPDSLALAQLHLQEWSDRITMRHADFSALPAILDELDIPHINGLIADLGISSWQLAQAERGLSFQEDGPLDMRMDPTSEYRTAAELLRRLSMEDLADLFRRYGEERHAVRIARAVVRTRRQAPLRTTHQLADLILQTVPAGTRHSRLHPATRVFQALRIAVNEELSALQRLLDQIPSYMAPGGRVVIISFHSLEDRLVKRAMRRWAQEHWADILTPRPMRPSEAEVAKNPRARSAKLRACIWQQGVA